MTNELEKQFFDTFGIEPIRYKRSVDDNAMFMDKVYPQISDRIYLELYCLICDYCVIAKLTVDELKQEILRNCIRLQRVVDIKHQVRTLFEEG